MVPGIYFLGCRKLNILNALQIKKRNLTSTRLMFLPLRNLAFSFDLFSPPITYPGTIQWNRCNKLCKISKTCMHNSRVGTRTNAIIISNLDQMKQQNLCKNQQSHFLPLISIKYNDIMIIKFW